MTQTRSSPSTRIAFPVVAVFALVAGAAVDLGLFAVGSAAGGAMAVHWPMVQAISAPIVVVASLVPTTIALVVTWLAARRRPAFASFARWAGAAVAVLSMAAPLIGGDDLATRLSIAPMHLVVGAAWFIAAGRIDRRS